jgi:hypothetical protein
VRGRLTDLVQLGTQYKPTTGLGLLVDARGSVLWAAMSSRRRAAVPTHSPGGCGESNKTEVRRAAL